MTQQDAENSFIKYFNPDINSVFSKRLFSIVMNPIVIGFNIFIIINHCIMALILWIRTRNSLANILLGFLLFLPVFALITNVLLFSDYIHHLVILFFLTPSLMMLFGPILFLYLNLLMGNTRVLNKRLLFHLTPAILILIAGVFMMTGFFNHDQFIEETRKGINPVYNFYNLLVIVHVISYLILGWREVKNYSDKIREFFTSIEELKLKWMKGFLATFSVLLGCCLLFYSIPAFISPAFLPYVETVIGPLLTACTYFYILFQGFSNQAVFHSKEYEDLVLKHYNFNEFIKTKELKRLKYGNSVMKESVLNHLDEKLLQLFEEQKPYLNKELTLTRLAEMLDISPNQLSQLINRRYKKNFFDFINEYRVKEAEKLLLHEEMSHLKIETIGELAGFNSRSTFFAIFRKMNGTTPAQFQSGSMLISK